MNSPTPPSPPAHVAEVRDALLAFLRQPECPIVPARDLSRRLRCALGLLKVLELADIEARLLELERTAQELKHPPLNPLHPAG